MKGELLKRLFRAIASADIEAIDKLTCLVIEEERKKGHTLLAQQLETINNRRSYQESSTLQKGSNSNNLIVADNLRDLTTLPTSR